MLLSKAYKLYTSNDQGLIPGKTRILIIRKLLQMHSAPRAFVMNT